MNKKYTEYLKSQEWADFRQKVFAYYGRKCGKCGDTPKKLEVHHHDYHNVFKETLTDVMVLCRPCHEKHHKRQRKKEKRLNEVFNKRSKKARKRVMFKKQQKSNNHFKYKN